MLSPTPPIDRSSLRPGTGYLIAPRVPNGLATVVESLTREVLRHRPEDIYVFAAHHFEKLLKLREEYHIEKYSDCEFNYEFNRDFNLWPTKDNRNIKKPSNSDWSFEKDVEIFERREQKTLDMEESQEDASTYKENRKVSRETYTKSPLITKKISKRSKDNETTDARATRIISQMTALHGPVKSIQTKDIKQELRKNKLSGEKSKTDVVEKGIRGDRRSRTKISKKDKDPREEIERATTTTTTSSSRTSARRPLKKVRRIETESETDTEHEIAAKIGLENGHTRSKIDSASHEAIARTGSRDRRSETRLSEHSAGRKVSSRALSMDRIRAYVLRKFASSASLEVLRSPTYVEQVQEVIDRAAPIIKEKLEELGRSRGKRSRSVDFAWNRNQVREEKRFDNKEKNIRKTSELEQKSDVMKKEEIENCLGKNETILKEDKEEKKLRRRSIGSGKRSRKYENDDFEVVDQVDDNSKFNNKLEYESDAIRDTLEARLTTTQSILEGISKSASELGGARKSEFSAGNNPESETPDHVNIVSLPVVRPPSSRNSRNAAKNGLDSVTLPPISPEVPKSTKKKDELSLPVLSTAPNNGNVSFKKLQEQDVSKDTEEASTMHDITSDIEDIAVLPENEDMVTDAKQNLDNDDQNIALDVEIINEEKHTENEDVNNAVVTLNEKRGSLEEFEKLEASEEGTKPEEVFKDSLSVTPEVTDDVPLRPDSLEPDEEEIKLQNDNADSVRENTFDRLKDKLIEIEMAERSIEKALACQVTTCDIGEKMRQVEKLETDGKKNEAREAINEVEETASEIQKPRDVGKILINKDDEKQKSIDIVEIKEIAEISEINKTEDLNIEERLNKSKEIKEEIEILNNEIESMNEKVLNDVKESIVEACTENVQSVNPELHDEESQIIEVVETDGDNTTTSKKQVESKTNESNTTSGNSTVKSECATINLANENNATKERKKRESNKSSLMKPLSLEVPYSYVLSEGSPCEIPDSVTTVIIPDRSCSSPVILEDENYQAMNEEEKLFSCSDKDISEDKRQNQHGEVFGEYIQPETTVAHVDADYIRGVKEIKPSQDIVIIHQDLDRIKEEGEEEEEKEAESLQENKNDQKTVKEEEMKKVVILENIVEHEETEEIDVRTIGEEISSSDVLKHESLSDTKNSTVDNGLNEGKVDVAVEVKSVLENSSEENESTQDIYTTTSSDIKESTASNHSIESPSPSGPVVPELNLDSLQDNTVSSFKMTANGTEKEDNGSPRESDATTSLIEPLTSDERLANRLIMADHEEEIITSEERRKRDLQSEIPEADQLYHAEHAEYEWLSKDPLSTEINLEDEVKSQENKDSPKGNVSQAIDSQEKAEAEELGSEEEIARELIDLLDKDMQYYDNKSDLEKNNEESVLEQLDTTDKSDQLLSESMHPVIVEQEKKSCDNSLEETANIIKTETIAELSTNILDVNEENEVSKNTETESIEEKAVEEIQTENLQIAPLAQFEQDELLIKDNKFEVIDEKITVESKPDVIADHIDIQEKLEENQANIEEVSEYQNNDSKIEESDGQQEENNQEELNQEKHEQEKLEACKEDEIKELSTHKENLDIQKETEEELKIPNKSDEENVEIKEVAAVSVEVFNKESMIESTRKDEERHEEINLDKRDEFITDQMEKNTENEKEIEHVSEKIESVHGPITSAISEQSIEDHSRFGDWITMTKSSTVETVIEASDSNTCTDNKTEIIADTSENITDKSLIRKKDDFHSAVVKIQAGIRGFLTRHRFRRSAKPKVMLNNVPLTQKVVTSNHLTVPQDTSNLREARRLRREEALRNTTLSLENAFATGRLQHTGEFHDSVPLLPFDVIPSDDKTNSITSDDSLEQNIDIEEVNSPEFTKSNESDSVHKSEHGTSFHKSNAFVDPTIPIMMHLLTDASRNCHFSINQNSHSFNPSSGGVKSPLEPTVDILMLGCPRDVENQYLNFITSVEDLGSLTTEDTMKYTKNTDDAHPSTASGEGSLREPLALPGISRGVVIEEITSLDELASSESTKPSTAPKTSLDTNSSMPSEECALEDAKNDLGMMSPRTKSATGDRKQKAEEGETGRNSEENVKKSDLCSEDTNKRSNNNREDMEGDEDNDKT